MNDQTKNSITNLNINCRAIINKFTVNDKGTYFASISIPCGKIMNSDKQQYIYANVVVKNTATLDLLAKSFIDQEINLAANVELLNLRAENSFDKDGNIQVNKKGVPYINYKGYLNKITF